MQINRVSGGLNYFLFFLLICIFTGFELSLNLAALVTTCKSIVITYHQSCYPFTLVVWLASLPLLGSFGFSSAYHPGCSMSLFL